MGEHRTITFLLNVMMFEYDETNSFDEDRFDVIGSTTAGNAFFSNTNAIDELNTPPHSLDDVLYVVYTERKQLNVNHRLQYITRIISARLATSFERGLYYGKQG